MTRFLAVNCPKCYREIVALSRRQLYELFIEHLVKVHGLEVREARKIAFSRDAFIRVIVVP